MLRNCANYTVRHTSPILCSQVLVCHGVLARGSFAYRQLSLPEEGWVSICSFILPDIDFDYVFLHLHPQQRNESIQQRSAARGRGTNRRVAPMQARMTCFTARLHGTLQAIPHYGYVHAVLRCGRPCLCRTPTPRSLTAVISGLSVAS